MRKLLLAAAAATSLISTSAFAEIRLDLTTDPVSGFAGKGDIKDLFGLTGNNSPNQIYWQYGSSTTYTTPCLQSQNGFEHATRRATIQASGVGGLNDARKNKGNENNTGYILTGSSEASEETLVACPGGFDPDPNPDHWSVINSGEGDGLQFSTNGTDWVDAPSAIIIE